MNQEKLTGRNLTAFGDAFENKTPHILRYFNSLNKKSSMKILEKGLSENISALMLIFDYFRENIREIIEVITHKFH